VDRVARLPVWRWTVEDGLEVLLLDLLWWIRR